VTYIRTDVVIRVPYADRDSFDLMVENLIKDFPPNTEHFRWQHMDNVLGDPITWVSNVPNETRLQLSNLCAKLGLSLDDLKPVKLVFAENRDEAIQQLREQGEDI
jgi:hypothetical protein